MLNSGILLHTINQVEVVVEEEEVEQNEEIEKNPNVTILYNLTNVFKCVGNKKEIEVEVEAKHLDAVPMNFDEELKFLEEWIEKPKFDED